MAPGHLSRSVARCDPARYLRARVEAELVEDGADVAVHGPLGQEQLRCDLPVAQSLRDQLRHLELTRAELVAGTVGGRLARGLGLAKGEAHRRVPCKAAARLELGPEPRRPQG